LTRITEGEVDLTGTPHTNVNYGNLTGDGENEIDVRINIQHISANDRKDGNFADYQKRGYIQRGLLKFKSTDKILNKDIYTHGDGFQYEVEEMTERYVSDGVGGQEFVYCEGLLIMKEGQ